MKTSELTGAALDWAVAKCEGVNTQWYAPEDQLLVYCPDDFFTWHPSTEWEFGGPLIELEKLCVGYRHQADPAYCPINDQETNCWARTTAGGYLSYGPTPLIAAMRCYVASKLGDEVEIPEELV